MPQVETMTRDKSVGNDNRSTTQALVLYSFESSSSNEMTITENQILTVIKSDDDWTLCKNLETSQLGYVPTQYIQIIVKPQFRPQQPSAVVIRKPNNSNQSTTSTSQNNTSTTTRNNSSSSSDQQQQEQQTNNQSATNTKPPLSARTKVVTTSATNTSNVVETNNNNSNQTNTTTNTVTPPIINTTTIQSSTSPPSSSDPNNFTSVKERIKFLQEQKLPLSIVNQQQQNTSANNATTTTTDKKRVQFVPQTATPRGFGDSSPTPTINTTTTPRGDSSSSSTTPNQLVDNNGVQGGTHGRPPKPKGYSNANTPNSTTSNSTPSTTSGGSGSSSTTSGNTTPSGTSPVLNNYLQMYGAVPILPFVKPLQHQSTPPPIDENYENAMNQSSSSQPNSGNGTAGTVSSTTQDNLLIDTRVVDDRKGLAKLGRSLSRKFKKQKNHHSAATPTSGDDDGEIIHSAATAAAAAVSTQFDYVKTSPRATTSFHQSPITTTTNTTGTGTMDHDQYGVPMLPPKNNIKTTRTIEEELDSSEKRKTLPVNMRNDLFQKMHSQLKMQSFSGAQQPSSTTNANNNENAHSNVSTAVPIGSGGSFSSSGSSLTRSGSTLHQVEDDVQFINETNRKSTMSKSAAIKIIGDKMKFYHNYRLMKLYLQKDESLKNARIRKQKVLEIVSTERDYVQNIHICVDEFLTPMRANPKKFGVKNEQLDVLFLNINQILQCNQELLKRLNEQMNEHQLGRTTCVKIGIVFREMAVWFKLYTDYINNHENATSTHDLLIERKKKFAAYIEKQQNNPKCKNLPLAAYLIQPVQRIPRYRLLLADVIKLTSTDHVDYDDLQKGYQAILEIADWVNERKRENENQHSLTKLQLKLTDSEFKQIFLPHRKLVSKTETLKSTITFKDNESDFDRYLAFNRQTEAYLFSDMLIIALGEQIDTSQQLSQPPQHIIMRDNLIIIYFVFVKVVRVEYMEPVEDLSQQTADSKVPNLVQITYALRGKDLLLEFNLESCDNHFSKKILSCITMCKKNVSSKTGMDADNLYNVSAQFNRILRSIPEIKDQMKKKKERATRMQSEISTISKEIERKEQEVLRLLEEINNLKDQKIQNELGISEAEQESSKSNSDFKQISEEKKKCQESVFSILGNDLFAYTEMFGSISNRDDK